MHDDKSSLKVLIVEDNTGDYFLIEDYLQEEFMNPVIVNAKTFAEAKKLLSTTTDINFILLDLSLPDIERASLLIEMLKLSRSIPVVVLTGYTDKSFAVKSLAMGISDYLLKDELSAQLLYKTILYSKERMNHQINITKAIITTQEEERFEMGAELHDNVCQILAGTLLNLGMAKKSTDDPNKFIEESENYIQLALKEIRNLSHRLAPASYENTSLKESINALFVNLRIYEKYEVIFEYSVNDVANKDLPIIQNLFRILQEQLNNIVKHAQASVLEIKFSKTDSFIKMQIKDNGIGFNVKNEKGGIGIRNMRKRTQLFNGIFILNSTPGKGCEIIIEMPFLTEEIQHL